LRAVAGVVVVDAVDVSDGLVEVPMHSGILTLRVVAFVPAAQVQRPQLVPELGNVEGGVNVAAPERAAPPAVHQAVHCIRKTRKVFFVWRISPCPDPLSTVRC
jgi:hypothetical protein